MHTQLQVRTSVLKLDKESELKCVNADFILLTLDVLCKMPKLFNGSCPLETIGHTKDKRFYQNCYTFRINMNQVC